MGKERPLMGKERPIGKERPMGKERPSMDKECSSMGKE